MVRANLHNFLMILGMAVIGFYLVKLAGKSRLAGVPVVGSVLQFANQAA